LKIKIVPGILIIDILSIFLVLTITILPHNPLRIVLAIPFLLFFPGFALISAVAVRADDMRGLERLALSLGLSIAMAVLIGVGLSVTPWGVRMESMVYSLAIFILVMSLIVMLRRPRAP
jgi:uncharacterized membrane protein